ncbi:hypothetical protein CSAL01_02210 [Colletotrichum salicis]|uniref:Rhodopsin domain-containing protein n=1 Tax=Colletotrichum salicis TaxID=1209931 RepID=A0A135V796_9PEZI|nr:hypothetical protein CSAL01_02210 [Colletotrichum salicis]
MTDHGHDLRSQWKGLLQPPLIPSQLPRNRRSGRFMSSAAGDDTWQAIEPQGLALGLLVTTVTLAVLTTIVMAMRMFIRFKTNKIGSDDWAMLTGFSVNLGQSAVVIYGSSTGIASRDETMNRATSIEGYKTLLIWQAFYAGSLCFIKSSICITLMRVTNQKVYLWILRGLIGLSFLMSGSGLIVILNQCHPLDKYWDKRIPGTCWPPIVATALSYGASVANVITDFSVAAIPFFLLRHVQMRSRLKFYVRLILGLGLFLPPLVRGQHTDSPATVDHAGNIVLWTIVECGLGIISGSLPMLRAFFKRLAKDTSTQEPYNRSGDTNLVTFGQGKGRQGPIYKTDLGVTVIGGAGDNESNNSNHDDDAESTRRIIKVTREVRHSVTEERETIPAKR